jgi:arsenate reductase
MLKILFICTHNRCRSILSESISNEIGADQVEARSAGSQPVGEVHPLSLKYLSEAGYPTAGLRSQSWDEFEDFAADLIVTVCDAAAGEACPVYFGDSLKVHWGLADPSKVEGSDAEKEQAFLSCIEEIASRAEQLKVIASQELDKGALRAALHAIGAEG